MSVELPLTSKRMVPGLPETEREQCSTLGSAASKRMQSVKTGKKREPRRWLWFLILIHLIHLGNRTILHLLLIQLGIRMTLHLLDQVVVWLLGNQVDLVGVDLVGVERPVQIKIRRTLQKHSATSLMN